MELSTLLGTRPLFFWTRSGRLLARIHVGVGPHGLCVWPQPGRYSLGHTDNMR